jgi:hypothetical protein
MTSNNRLANYVSVAERVFDAQAEITMVEVSVPVMLTGKMGYIQATVSMRDGRKATGTSSFMLDIGGNSAKATNPIEDCETSAIGRALAFLGYSSDKRKGYAIASREEVEEAQRRAESKASTADKRQAYVQRIEKMLLKAAGASVELKHDHLDTPFDDLDDAELVELGRSIKEQLAAHNITV